MEKTATEDARVEEKSAEKQLGIKEMLSQNPGLQSELDRIVENRLRRERDSFEKKIQSALAEKEALHQGEITELKSRVEEAHLSADEREKRATHRLAQSLEKEKEILSKQASSWEEKYKRLYVTSALADSAAKAGAYMPAQVVELLLPKTALEPNEEGNTEIVLRLPDDPDPSQALYRGQDLIKGIARYLARNPNLLAASIASGAGSMPGLRDPGSLKTSLNLKDPLSRKARKRELERLAGQGLATPTKF